MADMSVRRAVTIFGVGVIALIAGVATWFLTQSPVDERIQSGSVTARGSAQIGGPFTLIDQSGEQRQASDFAGRYMMIYFGYTFCPDICPTSLALMTRALDQLEAEDPAAAAQIVPIFITVDPERDTQQAMADYATHFHPRLVALTGSLDAIAAAAKAYRVYYAKVEDESMTDYLVDHSSIVFLMGPDGEFLTHFPHGAGIEDMVQGLRQTVGSREPVS